MDEPTHPSGSEDTRLVPANPTPTADEVGAAALARVRDVTSELVRLVRTVATQATDGWTLVSVVRPLVPEFERVFEERDALDHEVTALRADVADADERIRELEAQLALRATGWAAERTVLEADAARERDRSQTLTEDLERRQAEMERLAARERRAREQMETVAARAQADREETLRLAREMVQSAEEARIAVVEEMEQLRIALAAEQASLIEVQHEQARVTQGAAEREVELARSRQMLDQIEASRASAVAELTRTRASLVHTKSELLAAQHEYQLAQVQIDKLCSAHDELVEDRAHFVARLHDAKEREARLRLRITGLEQRLQAAHDGTPAGVEPADAAAQDATSELALELSRAEERMRQLETDLAKTRAAASAANLRIDGLHHQARTVDRARAEADAEIRTLRATILALESAAATATTTSPEPAGVAEQRVGSDAEAATDESAAPPAVEAMSATDTSSPIEPSTACTPIDLEPFTAFDESATAGDEVAADEPVATGAAIAIDDAGATPEAAAPTPVAAIVAVLDASDAWPADGAITVHRLDASADVVERLRTLDPGCCLVNLAASGAVEAVVAMRAARLETPLWSCAGGPHGSTARPLGPLDVVARPVDPERVRACLDAFAPRGANVIMVGSESATLIPIRQGALAAGMSIRTAWNRAQAADLAAAVHPDVVIVDLVSDPAAAAALLIDLAGAANPPRIVVVPGAAQQLTEFATALASHAEDASALERATLLETAAAATRR